MQGEGLGGSADPITLSSAACMPIRSVAISAPVTRSSLAAGLPAPRFLRPLRLHRLRGFSGRCDCIGFEDSQAVAIASASRILRSL